MQIELARHRAHPWRVHTLAADFTLLDAWQLPVELAARPGHDFEAFVRAFAAHGLQTDSAVAEALFRIRWTLGRWFGWDEPQPVPGRAEQSVAERLSEEDQRLNRAARLDTPATPVSVTPIYVFANEALFEVSNRTIHALIHVGAEACGPVELAIYVKMRGWYSRPYMALIGPFRHHIVYPALFRSLRTAWERERALAGAR